MSQWIKVVIVWLKFVDQFILVVEMHNHLHKFSIKYRSFSPCLLAASIWLFAFYNLCIFNWCFDTCVHTFVYIDHFIQLCANSQYTLYRIHFLAWHYTALTSVSGIHTPLLFNFKKPPSEEKWNKKISLVQAAQADNIILYLLYIFSLDCMT